MKPFDLKEYLANPNKKVVTRDGRNVTIYCTNYYYQHPIIAQIEGEERSHAFRETGQYNYYGESIGDLFFAPEKHEGWAIICGDSFVGEICPSKEIAEKKAEDFLKVVSPKKSVAIAKIEWEE